MMLTNTIVNHITLLCGLQLTGYEGNTCTGYIYDCMTNENHQHEDVRDRYIRCSKQFLQLNKSYGNQCGVPRVIYKLLGDKLLGDKL